MKISVIIPNWNNDKWLERCLNSILRQTYQPEEIIIADDCSNDESRRILHYFLIKYNKIKLIFLDERRFNGGSRNMALDNAIGDYIFYLDSDDYIARNNLFEEISQYKGIDCIRLNYIREDINKKEAFILNNGSLEEITSDCNVACWLKVTKRELCPRFPENTLMEDVIYHLKLMDRVETFVNIIDPAIVWNRLNTNSVSKSNSDKWCSSLYRYYADLKDLEVEKPYCEKERQRRLEMAYNNIKNDKFVC